MTNSASDTEDKSGFSNGHFQTTLISTNNKKKAFTIWLESTVTKKVLRRRAVRNFPRSTTTYIIYVPTCAVGEGTSKHF